MIGRVYYYNTRTKETTWNKPLELATPEERVIMLQKKQETLDFFREMEANIRYRIKKAEEAEAQGDDYQMSYSPHDIIYYRDDSKEATTPGRDRFNSSGSWDAKGGLLPEGRPRMNSLVSRRVRTISTMDGKGIFRSLDEMYNQLMLFLYR